MKIIICNVCYKAAINMEEHVLSEDDFISINWDTGKKSKFLQSLSYLYYERKLSLSKRTWLEKPLLFVKKS